MKKSYPWTKAPLITNGPMGAYISPKMAAEITKAGGFGFLGAGYDIKVAAKRLEEAATLVGGRNANGFLPVGLGVLCFTIDLNAFCSLLQEQRPQAVWLFGARDDAEYGSWAARIREASGAHIWIQTNTVTSALQIAQTAKPDVLVIQGGDAGGHGPVQGAGIISLMPEVSDAFAAAGQGHIPLIAAGGIVDGRGAAAALTLGAAGVTMGTRFLASDEVAMNDKGYLKALLETRDGGPSTHRSQLFDEIQNKDGSIWPVTYDGRALRNASSRDEQKGLGQKEMYALYAQDHAYKDDMMDSRAVAWAGTGVGLVNSVKPAAEIVAETREGALKILQAYSSLKL